jgi:hypothetical protein
MKKLFLFLFLFILSTNPAISQDDQGGGVGMKFRGFQVSEMQSDQTNPSTIMRNRRTGSERILTGIRRLVPQEYSTIQEAIDSSTHGDTILVSDGTYVENIRFHGKAIIVASLYLVDGDTSHIEQTIIDGSNPSHPDSASVVYFIDGEDTTSVLCGFTIRGGGGTTWIAPNQDVWRVGGGVYCAGLFGATIINNRITQNRVSGENAASGGVDFSGDQGFLILERNRIFGNSVSANPGHGLGGGVGIAGSGVYVRIVGNVFEQDTVVAQGYAVGGALYIEGFSSLVGGVVQGNVFRENIADATVDNGLGGGIFCFYTAAIEIRDNLFEGNIAKSQNGWAEGGAMIIDDEPPATGYGRKLVKGNRFINNMSSSSGFGGTGGALEIFRTLATVSGNYFEQNTAQGGTARGGAIRIFKSAFRLENNIITENTATFGGAVHVLDTPQSGIGLEIINNTIVNNFASSTGGGIDVSGVQAIVVNSILWGNTTNQIALGSGGSIEVRYSNIQGGWSGEGNINANPLFVDIANGDFHLQDISPCIGAGIDSIEIGGTWYFSPLTDLEGNPRPNPPGSMPDMGAYESPLGSPVTDVRYDLSQIPNEYLLAQNYPNPFNPVTTISYSLPLKSQVELVVYNTLGEEVIQLVYGEKEAGSYSVELDANGLSSGIYFYKLQAGEFVETKKMVLMK